MYSICLYSCYSYMTGYGVRFIKFDGFYVSNLVFNIVTGLSKAYIRI